MVKSNACTKCVGCGDAVVSNKNPCCPCVPDKCPPTEKAPCRLLKCDAPMSRCDIKFAGVLVECPKTHMKTFQDVTFNYIPYARDLSIEKSILKKTPMKCTTMRYCAKVNDMGAGPLHFKMELIEISKNKNKCGECVVTKKILCVSDHCTCGIGKYQDFCLEWAGVVSPVCDVIYAIRFTADGSTPIKLKSDKVTVTMHNVPKNIKKVHPSERACPGFSSRTGCSVDYGGGCGPGKCCGKGC